MVDDEATEAAETDPRGIATLRVVPAPGVVAVAVGVDPGADDEPPDPSIGLSMPGGLFRGSPLRGGRKSRA
ncbi:hypothetical protein ColLi_03535 [Colletotrichum liriopes]|uniref:Uncharacterized protein n=1 Tax=Colletotrichum liriopes TaxID=708192 RepID=A0AA37LQP0_9PEZI|nr:hypothetical protein ColLi_03535 [Colletotrichum liriopes]